MNALLSRLRANWKTTVAVALFVIVAAIAALTYPHWSHGLEPW